MFTNGRDRQVPWKLEEKQDKVRWKGVGVEREGGGYKWALTN